MALFRFGQIQAHVERVGPVSQMPGFEEYNVRISGPESGVWIKSTIMVRGVPRTSATDYDLATGVLGGLRETARDKKLFFVRMHSFYPNISDEELEATYQVAEQLSPYMDAAMEDAVSRIGMYHEGREKNIGPWDPGMGIARSLELPEHIGTKEGIANFFAYLFLVDSVNFHPDTPFYRYIDLNTKEPSFTDEEIQERDRLMVEAFQAAEAEEVDIYEIAILVTGLIEAQREGAPSLFETPEWLEKLSNAWV